MAKYIATLKTAISYDLYDHKQTATIIRSDNFVISDGILYLHDASGCLAAIPISNLEGIISSDTKLQPTNG